MRDSAGHLAAGNSVVPALPAMSESRPVRKSEVTADLVSRLIAEQFPQWADLPVLPAEGRRAFKERLPVDASTWARGRGWAIWKAMKVLVGALLDDPGDAAYTTGVIEAILADHLAAT
jgi:hypothetical protein